MSPSLLHQALVDFLRVRPDLLRLLIADRAPALRAEGLSLETLEGDLSVVTPPEYDADLVVLFRRGDTPVLAVVVEAQLGTDSDKRFRWPAYAAVARSRHHCDAVVVVLAVDRVVARWAARPIHTGADNTFRCIVIGPNTIPRIVDPAQAHGIPELAVLSALAHSKSQDALPIVFAALETFGSLDAERGSFYYDLMCVALPKAARLALENAMIKVDLDQLDTPAVRHWIDRGRQQGLEQGREQGREEGQRELLLEMIADRFGAVPAEVDARVRSAGSDDLRLWTRRLLSAASLSDVFGSA